MTTQTRVLPDLDEALDFEPKCEGLQGCDNPATWLSVTPCGHSRYGCDPCKRKTQSKRVSKERRCTDCRTQFKVDAIRWWPL